MNQWIKKGKVTIAAMTAVMALGVSAMSPISHIGSSQAEPAVLTTDRVISQLIASGSLFTINSLNTGNEKRIVAISEASKINLQLAAAERQPVTASTKGLEGGTSLFSFEGGAGEAPIPEDKDLENSDSEENIPAPEFLQIGLDHPIVATLQERLMELGYMDYAEPTQHFGSITQAAVILFQRQCELTQDGIVGPKTLEAILSDEAKPYTVLQGMRGDDVRRIQSRLYEMGYLATSDMVTGYFGDVTEAAVKKMQELNNLLADGKVGVQTINMLYSDEVKPNFLSYGEKSEVVLASQTRLKDLGYLTTTPDGVYGNDTAAAVKQFQSRNDLVVDGFLGPSTRNVLNSNKAVPNGLSLGDRGDTVTRVQQLLARYGYMSSSNSTGYYGEITEQAVKEFQSNNGLTSDGMVGMKTMAKLTSQNANKAGSSSSGTKPSSGSSSSSSSSKGSSSGNSSKNPSSNTGSSNSTSSSSSTKVTASVSSLIKVAKSKLGAPYVLGSKGPNSFDCSGFVYWCLNQVGVKQSYTTSYGWRSMSKYMKISNFSDIKAGDIVVVYGHVGIATGNGMVIDASSSSGKIVHRELGSWWKRNFIVAWRIFG